MVSDTIFRLIIIFLPSQLGLHFWPDYSRILGLRIDYLSPTIYLTHLLIVFLLAINLKKTIIEAKKYLLETKILLSFATLNIYLSINTPHTFLKWLEFAIYYLFFLYLKSHKNLLQKNLKYLYLSLSLVFFVQILQLVNQKSIGGLIYWLGERKFDASTPHLPKYQLFGAEFVRVPSIFSHANSLASFMFLSLLSLKTFKNNNLPKLIAIASIVISGSKNIFFFLPLYLVRKVSFKFILSICLLATTFLVVFSPTFNTNFYTISSRISGINYSTEVIKKYPIFGTGLGSYINGLGENLTGSKIIYENLQPVHNIYLLLLSETGLVGFVLLIIFVFRAKLSKNQSLLLSTILLTGLFDHYWLTLIQNKVLLTVLLASFPVEYET